jgi:hypothetical protein
MEHDLFGKPVSTFPDHALNFRRACQQERHTDGVVDFIVSVAREPLERRAQFCELGRIAFERGDKLR